MVTMKKKWFEIIKTVFCSLAVLISACAGSNEAVLKSNQPGALTARSDSAWTAPQTGATPKVANTDGQYLRVKFRQNDTEVEMVLDPKATNLALDLKRGPDGLLKVSNGDSVLYDADAGTANPEDMLQEMADIRKAGQYEKLTDEVIRDISLAQQLFYARRYEEALNVLKASLQKKKTATAYALGGSIYYVNGDMPQALQAWQNALRINPDMDEVRELLVRYTN
jgi:tetratricopeptide (TPR) repeat protein